VGSCRRTGSDEQGDLVGVGSGAWAGLCNTHFWVDRSTGVTGAIHSQTLPFVAPEVYQVYLDYEAALHPAL